MTSLGDMRVDPVNLQNDVPFLLTCVPHFTMCLLSSPLLYPSAVCGHLQVSVRDLDSQHQLCRWQWCGSVYSQERFSR